MGTHALPVQCLAAMVPWAETKGAPGAKHEKKRQHAGTNLESNSRRDQTKSNKPTRTHWFMHIHTHMNKNESYKAILKSWLYVENGRFIGFPT